MDCELGASGGAMFGRSSQVRSLKADRSRDPAESTNPRQCRRRSRRDQLQQTLTDLPASDHQADTHTEP
jgi:hypothetical protein